MKETKRAICDGKEIILIVRYGKNGRRYEWVYPTQETLDYLDNKYGVEQIDTCKVDNQKGYGVWLYR